MKTTFAILFAMAVLVVASGQARAQGSIELISVNATGGPSNSYSYEPSISANGRYVAFYSCATNLVSPATTACQAFVRDRQSGTTALASVNLASTGGGNSNSMDPSISPDGRHLVFASQATDLTADTVSNTQIFVRDLDANTTELVSWNLAGTAGGNGYSWAPVISADNRYVAFESQATDLIAGGVTWTQIYVRDLVTDTTILVSAADTDAGITPGNSGSNEPSISGDGRYVTFHSASTDLVSPATSNTQIFRRDLVAGITEVVSTNALGTAPGNGYCSHARITPGGRWVSFASQATDIVSPATTSEQMFLRDMSTGETVLVSQSTLGAIGDNGSGGYGGGLSSDGRYVTFNSYATNLVPLDTNGYPDTFVRDRVDAATIRAGEGLDGGEPNNMTENSAISAIGRFVAFTSYASNLVAGDTNSYGDIFVYEVFVPTPDAGVDGGVDGGLDAGIDGGDSDVDTDTGSVETDSDSETGSVDGDTDTDTDGDTDSDSDGDTDTDSDSDSDSDTGTGDVDTGSDTDTHTGGDGGGDAGSDGNNSSDCGCTTAGAGNRANLFLLLGRLI
jgi:hypothetical protein